MLKNLQRLILASLVILACVLGSAGWDFASGEERNSNVGQVINPVISENHDFIYSQGQEDWSKTANQICSDPTGCDLILCGKEPVIDSEIPENPDAGCICERDDFDNFAWKTFVALNWPADTATEGDSPKKPRVWESYEQFLPGTPPSPPQTDPPEVRLLGEAEVKFPPDDQAEPSFLYLRMHKDVPNFDAPLVDQFGSYLLSEMRINPIEVEQITREKLFEEPSPLRNSYCKDYDEQGECQEEKPLFLVDCSNKETGSSYGYPPCQENNGVGAMEIKAAWMIVPNEPEARQHFSDEYYTTNRTIKVKSAEGDVETDVPVEVALVGFHISAKTSRVSWIWATFEHICNVPDSDDPAGACPFYNFNQPDCNPSCWYCQENTPFVKTPYLWQDETPHAITEVRGNIEPQISSQITRKCDLNKHAKYWNEKWQTAISESTTPFESSIWKNYKLIGTQWLINPSRAYYEAATSDELNTSGNLANVTLEPYIQEHPIGNSCINCHARAKLPNEAYSDFSFVFPKGLPAPDVTLPSPLPID